MPKLRVFPDTGVLVAMIVFPTDWDGEMTLAGEVRELYKEGHFELVVSETVAGELQEVIAESFAGSLEKAQRFLAPFSSEFTREPTPEEIESASPAAGDPDDAPIFAAAVIAKPDLVLSNDFQSFHSLQAKAFWARHGIQVDSLYGLLVRLGKRERRNPRQERSPDSPPPGLRI